MVDPAYWGRREGGGGSVGGVVEGGHTSQTALSTRQTNTIKKPKNYKSTLVHLFKIGH